MEKSGQIKFIIQVVAMVFFTVQMAFALQRYLDKPTMSSPGSKPLKFGRPVQVTVCRDNQFRFGAAHDLGYDKATDLYAGIMYSILVVNNFKV